MNKENLLKMAALIETVPQEMFDMGFFRSVGQQKTTECHSVGCIIGHCTILDPEGLENFKYWDGEIDFHSWSEHFTGIDSSSNDWYYLFGERWSTVDNTPTGAAQRIRHYVEHGLPEDWSEQMYGKKPLTYLR